MKKRKPATKRKASKKKTPAPKGKRLKKDLPMVDEWGNDISLVELRGGKCLVVFPTHMGAQGYFDGDFGLIAVLDLKGIRYESINQKDPYELVVVYPKKDLRKIQRIERAYFSHKIKVEAKEMSEQTMFFINGVVPTGADHNFSGKPMEHE